MAIQANLVQSSMVVTKNQMKDLEFMIAMKEQLLRQLVARWESKFLKDFLFIQLVFGLFILLNNISVTKKRELWMTTIGFKCSSLPLRFV